MGNIGQRIGAHDTGFWDKENPIQAEKKPIASGLGVNEALAKAKSHAGAELVVVDAQGKASVHSLSIEDSFLSESKKVLISELDRNPADKIESSKTPLAIDNNVAKAFQGQAAFLVDDQSTSTYLGDDVDKTTPAVKLKDAEQFLSNPSAAKIEAAYAIAKDGGNERHVDTALAGQTLDQLHQNYRQQDTVSQDINLLKDGPAKTQVNQLLTELKTLSGQESSRVGELSKQVQARTAKFKNEIAKPTQDRDTALNSWNSANAQESEKVKTAAHDLREARMPTIFKLEEEVGQAQSHSSQMRGQLEHASTERSQAQSKVNELERLPAKAESHEQKANQLERDNQGLYIRAQTYTLTTLSQVGSEIRSIDNRLSRLGSDLSNERNKPAQPSDGSGNSDPYGKDPFAGGGSSGTYRDEGRIRGLERDISSLRSERANLIERQGGLEMIQRQLTYTRDIDRLSTYFYQLEPIDRLAMGQFKSQKDNNDRGIRENGQQASQLRSQYSREINGAQRNLSTATINETSAQARFGQAESKLAELEQEVAQLKNNPLPDTHAEVKPKAAAYQQAVNHKQATVGSTARLTQNRDQTQAKVDQISADYRSDDASLQSQISNVQQTLQSEARAKIAQTRQSIR